MEFDYSRLRGKIKEVYKTEYAFCHAMDCMAKSTLSLKLNGKTEWSQEEMYKATQLLSEPVSKIGYYFFCLPSSEN